MAIDPAQSFSNALGQGLGIMKSYRDEARQDEDRSFEKSMKLETQRQAQEQLKLLIKDDGRKQGLYDEDMTPDRIANRNRVSAASADLTEAQAKDAGILAANRQDTIDTDKKVALGTLAVNQTNAGSQRMNAITSRGEFGLRSQMYRDEQEEKIANRALQDVWKVIGTNGRNPTPENMRSLMGNKIAGSALIKMASKAYDSPILEEIMQNPFGDWMKSGQKLGVALRFARDTEVVNATVKAQGFNPSKTRATKFQAVPQKGADGKTRQMIAVTLSGPDARTGKNKTFTGFVKPETLFESGAVAANVFRGINNDPVLRGRMVQMYQATQEDKYYKILGHEAARLEKLIKDPPQNLVDAKKGVTKTTLSQAYQRRLTALENGDLDITTDTVFKYMGRIGS
jgi:hypothetical protein